MDFLFDANDDWQESLRARLYPKLHPYLDAVGLYAVGKTPSNQYVGKVGLSEETFEEELEDIGCKRNPIACLKSTVDGRESEGSWVLLPEDTPEDIPMADDRQLHLTLFPRRDGKEGREVYAHEEYDWRDRPIAHIRSKHFAPRAGASKTRTLLNRYTYFKLH
jgi:hypothetical protein